MTTQPYPAKIHLSPPAESYLEQLGTDLLLGIVDLHQLPPSVLQLWTFAYEAGRASMRPALQRAEHDADRLYFEMSIRQPQPRGDYVSWADLQRRRAEREAQAAGNYPGGSLIDAWNVA